MLCGGGVCEPLATLGCAGMPSTTILAHGQLLVDDPELIAITRARSGGGEAPRRPRCDGDGVPSGAYVPFLPSDGAAKPRGATGGPHVMARLDRSRRVVEKSRGHHRHRPPILTDLLGQPPPGPGGSQARGASLSAGINP